MYTHIYPDSHTSTVYVAGFAKSVKSYTLHVTTLDIVSGEVIASVNIPASINNVLTDYLLLGPSRVESSLTTNGDASIGPSLVWLSSSTAPDAPVSLLSAPLSPSLRGKALTLPNVSYKRIQDVDLSGNGLFMAFQDNGTAQVLGYETRGSPVKVLWNFGDEVSNMVSTSVQSMLRLGQSSSSEPHFSGVLNADGKPFIGKVIWSNVHNVSFFYLPQTHFEWTNQP